MEKIFKEILPKTNTRTSEPRAMNFKILVEVIHHNYVHVLCSFAKYPSAEEMISKELYKAFSLYNY